MQLSFDKRERDARAEARVDARVMWIYPGSGRESCSIEVELVLLKEG